jgi:hypothetical protein
LPERDFYLEVLKGTYSDHEMVSIIGHDSALTTTRTTIGPSITTANIDQSGLVTTPATVDVASTDANDDKDLTGLRTVRLFGLDANGVEQNEIITLEGQAEQTSANTYSAVTGLRGLSWGSTGYNEGVLWAGNGTFTAGVPTTKYFAMGIQQNKGLTAYYVVPKQKTLYLRQLTLNVATASKDVEFFLETSTNGSNWITEAVFGMEPGEFQGEIIAVPGIVPGTHIRVEAVSSASATNVIAIVGCILVD